MRCLLNVCDQCGIDRKLQLAPEELNLDPETAFKVTYSHYDYVEVPRKDGTVGRRLKPVTYQNMPVGELFAKWKQLLDGYVFHYHFAKLLAEVSMERNEYCCFKHNDAIETAHSCSFTEFALAKVSKDKHGRADILEFTERNIIRIYPGGNRVDSSNYDPQPAWNMGCQLAALNAQGGARPMWLNGGFFRANGGCG